MTLVFFVLLLLAAFCFGLVAANSSIGKLNPLGLGLVFLVLVPLLQVLQKL